MVTTKQKTYSRHTKDKEKGNKAYHYGKSPIQKGKQQERKKEERNNKIGKKTIRCISKSLSIITLNVNILNSSI